MQTRPISKQAHICLTAFGAFYLAFVFLMNWLIESWRSNVLEQQPQPILLYLACIIAVFGLACLCLHLLSSRRLPSFEHSPVRGRLSPALFLIVSACAAAVYLAYLAAYYPGGYSADTAMQWEQAHSMVFDDHHPFFHTFFFVVLTRLWNNYTFLLLVQILAFSCGLGYLAATMQAWGFRLRFVLPVCALIALATPTRDILMFFWKDTALSVFFLYLLSHIFNIALSGGKWLKKANHWFFTAVLLACITLVRHNAVLLTAPMLVLMLLFLPSPRRACLKMTALVLLLVIGVKGPLYALFDVDTSNDSYLETTGLPMTILFSSYVYSPDTMPQEAFQLLEQLEDHETAVQNYEFGNYNSIKWFWDMDYAEAQDKLAQTPIADFMQLTLETVRGNPSLAVHSVVELTDVVWDPVGLHYHLVDTPRRDSPAYFPIPENVSLFCAGLFERIDSVLDAGPFQKISCQLGVLILIMLLACYLSIHHFHGWSALWIILPIMCYNFGTMLLLCGPDYRFFHFNCIAAYPLAMLLLSRPRKMENETCI